MVFYLNLNAVLRQPLNRKKRREFPRNPDNLLDDVARKARRELEETRLQLAVANNLLQQAMVRGDELIRSHGEVERQLRRENAALAARAAALAERAALAEELKNALTSVALADTVAAQVADARDRLASRLELLTSELSDVRRSINSAGAQDGSK